MLFLLLLLVILAGFMVDSVRLFMWGVLALLFRLSPLATLSTIGAVIAWAIKSSLRR